jgi:hypothetical protein
MRTVERAGYLVAALLLVSGLIHVAILVAGDGLWQGPVSLRKPATFGLSFGLTLATIVWVASWLQLGRRSRALLLGTFTAACVTETVLVSVQAWRGVPSHFNLETPFDAMIARSLAAGGAVLVVVVASLALAAFRRNDAIAPSLRLAIRVGFVMLLASIGVGAAMIATGMRLVFAGHPQAAYMTAGALKPAHAVMLHAILVLPGFARLLSFVDWTERRRAIAVAIASATYLAVAAAVAVENILGV